MYPDDLIISSEMVQQIQLVTESEVPIRDLQHIQRVLGHDNVLNRLFEWDPEQTAALVIQLGLHTRLSSLPLSQEALNLFFTQVYHSREVRYGQHQTTQHNVIEIMLKVAPAEVFKVYPFYGELHDAREAYRPTQAHNPYRVLAATDELSPDALISITKDWISTGAIANPETQANMQGFIAHYADHLASKLDKQENTVFHTVFESVSNRQSLMALLNNVANNQAYHTFIGSHLVEPLNTDRLTPITIFLRRVYLLSIKDVHKIKGLVDDEVFYSALASSLDVADIYPQFDETEREQLKAAMVVYFNATQTEPRELILYIEGLKRLDQAHKDELFDALFTMDLVNAARDVAKALVGLLAPETIVDKVTPVLDGYDVELQAVLPETISFVKLKLMKQYEAEAFTQEEVPEIRMYFLDHMRKYLDVLRGARDALSDESSLKWSSPLESEIVYLDKLCNKMKALAVYEEVMMHESMPQAPLHLCVKRVAIEPNLFSTEMTEAVFKAYVNYLLDVSRDTNPKSILGTFIKGLMSDLDRSNLLSRYYGVLEKVAAPYLASSDTAFGQPRPGELFMLMDYSALYQNYYYNNKNFLNALRLSSRFNQDRALQLFYFSHYYDLEQVEDLKQILKTGYLTADMLDYFLDLWMGKTRPRDWIDFVSEQCGSFDQALLECLLLKMSDYFKINPEELDEVLRQLLDNANYPVWILNAIRTAFQDHIDAKGKVFKTSVIAKIFVRASIQRANMQGRSNSGNRVLYDFFHTDTPLDSQTLNALRIYLRPVLGASVMHIITETLDRTACIEALQSLGENATGQLSTQVNQLIHSLDWVENPGQRAHIAIHNTDETHDPKTGLITEAKFGMGNYFDQYKVKRATERFDIQSDYWRKLLHFNMLVVALCYASPEQHAEILRVFLDEKICDNLEGNKGKKAFNKLSKLASDKNADYSDYVTKVSQLAMLADQGVLPLMFKVAAQAYVDGQIAQELDVKAVTGFIRFVHQLPHHSVLLQDLSNRSVDEVLSAIQALGYMFQLHATLQNQPKDKDKQLEKFIGKLSLPAQAVTLAKAIDAVTHHVPYAIVPGDTNAMNQTVLLLYLTYANKYLRKYGELPQMYHAVGELQHETSPETRPERARFSSVVVSDTSSEAFDDEAPYQDPDEGEGDANELIGKIIDYFEEKQKKNKITLECAERRGWFCFFIVAKALPQDNDDIDIKLQSGLKKSLNTIATIPLSNTGLSKFRTLVNALFKCSLNNTKAAANDILNSDNGKSLMGEDLFFFMKTALGLLNEIESPSAEVVMQLIGMAELLYYLCYQGGLDKQPKYYYEAIECLKTVVRGEQGDTLAHLGSYNQFLNSTNKLKLFYPLGKLSIPKPVKEINECVGDKDRPINKLMAAVYPRMPKPIKTVSLEHHTMLNETDDIDLIEEKDAPGAVQRAEAARRADERTQLSRTPQTLYGGGTQGPGSPKTSPAPAHPPATPSMFDQL